ncbi:MAG: hypothetical protein K1X50_03575, partial [Candidatus Promineofilum sp.]|nr:hypothetical protein [Promineifilum sp.]
MNAARWWSLDPQLGLPMIDPGAWVGALPAANPLLVSTFADGASLAATGSARSVITAVTGAPPLRAAAW